MLGSGATGLRMGHAGGARTGRRNAGNSVEQRKSQAIRGGLRPEDQPRGPRPLLRPQLERDHSAACGTRGDRGFLVRIVRMLALQWRPKCSMPPTGNRSHPMTSLHSGQPDRLSAAPADLFIYGSLLFAEVMRVLIGRAPDSTPAALVGWCVAALPGRVYPALVRAEAAQTFSRPLPAAPRRTRPGRTNTADGGPRSSGQSPGSSLTATCARLDMRRFDSCRSPGWSE
jgi:Gamma-glutamyl cyclotransferase, AIG2-like